MENDLQLRRQPHSDKLRRTIIKRKIEGKIGDSQNE